MGAMCGSTKAVTAHETAGKKEEAKSDLDQVLINHGVDNERVRNGLMVAFPRDENGEVNRKELDEVVAHLQKLKGQTHEQPHDLNAIINLGSRTGENYENPGNKDLKMFLTSSGLTPGSTPGQLHAFKALKDRVEGKNGVIYMIDARLMTLQFHLHNADPDKSNNQDRVAYARAPDVPGGQPCYNKEGKLIMKSQKELSQTGDEYPDAHWCLRNSGSYGNVHLSILTENIDNTPVYVTYLAYDGTWNQGKPQYKILVGKGVMRGDKFVAFRKDGQEFAEEDYDRHCDYEQHDDFFFKETSDEDFATIAKSVQVIHGVGGIPVIPMLRWQPHFIHDGMDSKVDNPYGKSILDAMKSGTTYIGMSAGSMVWGWCIGPLTTDPDELSVMGADGKAHTVDLGPAHSLGKFWMFPGLGEYVGIPHEISLKCHKRFDPSHCKYAGNAAKAEAVGQVVSALKERSRYCALLMDYNWGAGHGDCLEIADSKIYYHVGFSDEREQVHADVKPHLAKLGSSDVWMTKQPAGNPREGWKFEWSPKDGEVVAAGPNAQQPFHMYAGSNGLLDHPPNYTAQK